KLFVASATPGIIWHILIEILAWWGRRRVLRWRSRICIVRRGSDRYRNTSRNAGWGRSGGWCGRGSGERRSSSKTTRRGRDRDRRDANDKLCTGSADDRETKEY